MKTLYEKVSNELILSCAIKSGGKTFSQIALNKLKLIKYFTWSFD